MGDRQGSPALLHEAGVVSLVHVGGPPRGRRATPPSLLDGCFLALDRVLTAHEPVTLAVGAGPAAVPVGETALLDPRLALGTLVLDGVTIDDLPLPGQEHNLILVAPPESAPASAAAATLRVGDTPVLQGRRLGGLLVLEPAHGSCFRLRANASAVVDPDGLPSAGVYELVLRDPTGSVLRTPIAAWRKTLVDVPAVSPPVVAPLRRPGPRPAANP